MAETYACLLLTAQQGGLPDVTQKYLAPFRECVAKLPPQKAPVWRFLSQSYAELAALEKQPNVSVTELCDRHNAVWSLLGSEATSARLRKLDPDTGYMHLATHAELSGSDPRNSYLVMAQGGRMRASDIYDLDWQGVRLVTLSACKTALQEGTPGAAITNLAEAFRVAGGRSVVASLWSVSDDGTEKLMVEFYRALAQGKSLAAALQQAEQATSKTPRFAHPFYWASFTLFGDWR